MPSLEKLKRQVLSTDDLHTVVSTMKTLSAVNMRQYEAAVESLSEYAKTVAQGLQIVLKEHKDELISDLLPQKVTAIIFGSDTGLCGRFNENIVSYVLEDLEASAIPLEHVSLIAVGSRIALELSVLELKVAKVINLPSSLSALTSVAQDLLFTLETEEQKKSLRQTLLYYNRPAGRASFKARKLQIFPLDMAWLKRLAESPWQSRTLASFTMNWQELFAALIREYYFVSLYRTLAESLSSENAARFAAMQAAEQNIEEHLDDLKLELNLLRQSSITEELQDIMAGAELLGVA